MARTRTLTIAGMIALAIALAALGLLSRGQAPGARAQEGAEPQSREETAAAVGEGAVDFLDLYRMNGRVLAEGRNDTPAGPLNVRSYRVEVLELPALMEVWVDGQARQVKRAYRVTVAGGPFPVRAMPPVIWIGDTPLPHARESVDLAEVAVVVFDRSVLVEGAAIAVSHGAGGDSRSTVQAPLSLSGDAQ